MGFIKVTQLCFACMYLVAACWGQCDDIDPVACQIMASKNADLCKDPTLSQTACPKFCKQCPLVCYHCDSPVQNYTDCKTTRSCQSGEQCMLHQLASSKDGHHEYKMNCASLDMCDGKGVMVFGRRDINKRNVMTQCCSDDLCNSPGYRNTESTTTTRPTTNIPGCDRDIEILIQDSRKTNSQYVIQFLKDLVSHIQIGPQHNQLGVAVYNDDVSNKFDLDSHTDKADLLNAIDRIHLHLLENDVDKHDVLEFLERHLHAGHDGDRLLYKDVIVILTDHPDDRRRFLHDGLLNSPHHDHDNVKLSSISKDVIVINIGTAAAHSAFSTLATNADHVIDVTDYSALSSTLSKLLRLICA